jgi:flagellar protein FlaF
MYQFSYAESLQDDPVNCRDRERRAMEHAIALLQQAEIAGVRSSATTEALSFLCTLWSALIDDLVNSENELPDVLRADLLSIGFWIIREAGSIRCGQSESFRGLIDICVLIRDGLK